jgi:spore coat protein A
MSDHDRLPSWALSRRQLFKFTAATGVVATVPQIVTAPPSTAATTRLSGLAYAQANAFTQPFRAPHWIDMTGTQREVTLSIRQFSTQVLTGYPATKLWGYGIPGRKPTWPGPTFVAWAGKPVRITFDNDLPRGTVSLADGGHLLPVDNSLLDEAMLALPPGEKPLVTHLHGSHVEWESDGYPEAWYTQNGYHGEWWRKAVHYYDNSQRGGTLWYHDHTHGITRLNIYAGLAGNYFLRDDTEYELTGKGVLPHIDHENELTIQDRWFTDDGQLSMDTTTPPENGIEPSIFCDFMLVNGVPWPVMEVEPRKYRFRVLNGSDSRIYVLALSSGAPLLVIGSELGLLRQAVAVNQLPIAPGERYDVVVDLTDQPPGGEVVLLNRGVDGILRGFRNAAGVIDNRPTGTAFGFGGPVNPASTGQLMKFRVSKKRSAKKNATVMAGTRLGDPLPELTATRTRQVLTFNGSDKYGRFMEMLGSMEGGTAMWMEPATEIVEKGTVEVWEIYNTGPVAHPIHLHLVDFEVLDRTPFTWTSTPMPMPDGVQGAMIEVTGTGTSRGPEAYEVGRKDTVICYPNEVTRVAAKFDRAGNYVWHCHILHHEDHDMMRPVIVR